VSALNHKGISVLPNDLTEDASDIFLVDADICEPSSVDLMIIVNTAAINFLEFDGDIYDYLDALSDTGIDAREHLKGLHEILLR